MKFPTFFPQYLASLFLFAACSGIAGASPASAQISQSGHVVALPASGLIYDDVHKKVYAAVGSKGTGATTNSITVIDPVTGAIGASVFVGDGPGSMTLSEGSKYLFVVVSDGSSVRQIDLATMTPGPLYPIPRGGGDAFERLLPLPGQPNGFLGLFGNHSRYTHEAGVFIDGKLQGATSGCGPCIAPGVTPTRLFMYQNQISSWDFGAFDVVGTDVVSGPRSGSVLTGAVGFSGSLNGLIITDNGNVIDPELRQIIGHAVMNGKTGPLLPDPRTGCVYCISDEGSKGQSISACDMKNFQFLGTVPVPTGVSGGIGNPIRWGDDGFGYTVGDKIVLGHMSPGKLLPYVDLAVHRVGMSKTLGKDNQLTYHLTVTNGGTASSSAAYLSEQLPPDAEVVSTKSSQGNVTAADGILRGELGALAAGATATVDVTLKFSDVHDVHYTAVVRGREPDPHPGDNIDRYTAPDTLSSLPDLTGTWDALKQVVAGNGINLQVAVGGEFTVRNTGNATAREATLRFYVSARPGFDAAHSQLLQEMTLPPLRRGEAYTADFRARLGDADDITGLYIFAVLDPENQIAETTKRNNVVGKRVP